MAQIDNIGTSYPDDNDLPKGCKVGYGYKENNVVINTNSAENADTPPVISEEEIEAHTMGFVLIEHFNMNKGVDIFGNRSKTTVMKELQKIHDMKAYKIMYASTLT